MWIVASLLQTSVSFLALGRLRVFISVQFKDRVFLISCVFSFVICNRSFVIIILRRPIAELL